MSSLDEESAYFVVHKIEHIVKILLSPFCNKTLSVLMIIKVKP